MGQAKRKKEAQVAWESGLNDDERQIAKAARALYENIVKPMGLSGACYRLAFFLAAYLHDKHNITVEPVVGYANDGTGPIMTSHAWIEYGGKKTDVSLTVTEHADAQPTGALLILDYPVAYGRANYSYHRTMSQEAITEEHHLAQEPKYMQIIMQKKREHRMMEKLSKDKRAIREYLDGAPDGLTYARMASLIDA
jgi:hypothetical protein